MRILIAEDDAVSRSMLGGILQKWGYEVVVATNGAEAWQALQSENPPPLAILDWMMPEMDGLEVCRKVRQSPCTLQPYLILLTARVGKRDVVEGLEAGADDFMTKPFDRDELRARLHVGERILGLQNSLAGRVQELEAALTRVRQLQGLLPICSYCKKIRNDRNYWQQVESYISEHTEAVFSHGICPECFEKVARQERGERESNRQAPP